LPAGLTLSIITGEISGTPTELSTNTTYTITVRNSGGTNTTTITIEVLDEVPAIAYSPNDLDLTNNTASSDLPLSPTITGSGEIVTWAISPSLPSGLSFGTSNGTIWGIPTTVTVQTSFTVYGNNSGGSSTYVLNLSVGQDVIGPFEYIPENNTITNNSLVHIAPSFINTAVGNGSSWGVASGIYYPGDIFDIVVGDSIYFSANNGGNNQELFA
jgi:hypothetical protein